MIGWQGKQVTFAYKQSLTIVQKKQCLDFFLSWKFGHLKLLCMWILYQFLHKWT